MAINNSNRHSARHACITCATGNGKGIAVTSLVYPSTSCLAVFDPYGEYDGRFGRRKAFSYRTRRGFARAFAAAWKSHRPFVVVYHPQADRDRLEEMEWFGQLMWMASDGNRVLHVLFEEFGKCTESISKDDTIAGEIATGGRKFGMIAGYVFQRSAEVPKTIWGNCPIKVIGAQEYTADVKRIQDQLGCSADDVAELGRLNQAFSTYVPAYDDRVKTKCHYLVARGLMDFSRQAALVYPNRHLVKKWSAEQKRLHQESRFTLVNPEILK